MDMTVDETAQALVAKGEFWFGGGASIDRIHYAEKRVGLKFPAAYTVWLLRYGGGGAKEASVSGIFEPADDLDPGSVIGDTLRLREQLGLPDTTVVILRNDDVSPWCLQVEPGSSQCPVVSFENGQRVERYPDFDAFFADYVIAWAQDVGRELLQHRPGS